MSIFYRGFCKAGEHLLIIQKGSQVEPLLESNYEKQEELNGSLQISFDSFLHANNAGHTLLDFETLIEDEDGHVYVVKQLSGDVYGKRAVAVHEFFSLADDFKYDIYGGTRTFNQFASWLFQGTGWTFVNADITGSALIPNFGENNPLQLIEALCAAFQCEREILPGKVVRFAKVVGEDNDVQFRYRHNIETISYQVDTTNLKTQIRGYGANGLVATYTSPLASHPRIGIRIAEPLYNDSYTTLKDLEAALAQELPDEPETNIEVKVTMVDGNVGDFVWLIHEELGFDYQTRILSKKTKRDYKDSAVQVGNMHSKSITDILISQRASIDENKRVTRSKFEQTNDRITMEVETIGESISTLEIRADQIAMSVIDTKNELSSTITQTATQIRSEVTDVKNTLSSSITQTASQIRSEVTDVKNNLTSSITQTATQIRTEVSASVTTINNKIQTVTNSVSSLTQTANEIQSTVSSQSTQLSGLGTRVTSAESKITQHANQISSKVSETDYNGNTIASLINQTATSIKLKAQRIEFEGQVFGEGATFSGDIETYEDVYVGRNIYMQGNSGGRIQLPRTDCYISASSSGNMTIEAFNDISLIGSNIDLHGDVRFYGDVDGVAMSDTSGLGFGYSSSSNRLYVRLYGSNVGHIDLT